MNYKQIIDKQLAEDFHIESEMIRHGNLFSSRKYAEKARHFRDYNPLLKVLSYDNQLVISCGNEELLSWCRQEYQDYKGEWFSKIENLRKLDHMLANYGCQIADMHHYFIPDEKIWSKKESESKAMELKAVELKAEEEKLLGSGIKLKWFHEEALFQFYGDKRFYYALSFDDKAKDEMAVAAVLEGEETICAMAGVSHDSDLMWQIGIDVVPGNRSKGLGSILTKQITAACLKRGVVPFYGTAESHNKSNAIAIRCGFVPGWWELYTEEIK